MKQNIVLLAMKDGSGGESRALNIIRKTGNYEKSELNFTFTSSPLSSLFAFTSSSSKTVGDGLGDGWVSERRERGAHNKQIRFGYRFDAE